MSREGFEGQKYRRTTRSRWRLRSDVVMRDVPSYGTRCIRRTSKRTSSHSTTCQRGRVTRERDGCGCGGREWVV